MTDCKKNIKTNLLYYQPNISKLREQVGFLMTETGREGTFTDSPSKVIVYPSELEKALQPIEFPQCTLFMVTVNERTVNERTYFRENLPDPKASAKFLQELNLRLGRSPTLRVDFSFQIAITSDSMLNLVSTQIDILDPKRKDNVPARLIRRIDVYSRNKNTPFQTIFGRIINTAHTTKEVGGYYISKFTSDKHFFYFDVRIESPVPDTELAKDCEALNKMYTIGKTQPDLFNMGLLAQILGIPTTTPP